MIDLVAFEAASKKEREHNTDTYDTCWCAECLHFRQDLATAHPEILRVVQAANEWVRSASGPMIRRREGVALFDAIRDLRGASPRERCGDGVELCKRCGTMIDVVDIAEDVPGGGAVHAHGCPPKADG